MYNCTSNTYEEVFISPFEKDTKGDALRTLQQIRDAHPASCGWIEIDAFAEQLPNGKWRAVRHHKHVRQA